MKLYRQQRTEHVVICFNKDKFNTEAELNPNYLPDQRC